MASRNEKRLVSVVLGCIMVVCSVALQPVNMDGSLDWDEDRAPEEVEKDINDFLTQYDREYSDLEKISEQYKESLIKDTGIRRLGVWGMNLARVYDLFGSEKKDIYARMRKNAEELMSSFQYTYSYIEDTEMAGWPMYVGLKDKKPSFEAFNSGHMAAAVCHAARAAADNGDEALASEWVSSIMDFFYDNYLTDDTEKTKLQDGWVVYVPSKASSERRKRHLESTDQQYCLDVPQAFNHGILAARAAIACDQAISSIDWDDSSDSSWKSRRGWSKSEAQSKMQSFIKESGELLLDKMVRRDVSGGPYPGSADREYFEWKYRDVSNCPEDRGTFKDRFEDIAHGPYEVNFFVEFREWGGPVSDDDMHRFAMTFLSQIVRDYGAKGGEKFACDVAGTYDDSRKGPPGYPEKNCENSRELWKRATHAPLWLSSAYSLRDEARRSRSVRCDVYLMMKTVLPMLMRGNDQFDSHFKNMDSHWGSHAIQAKYYFYNFAAGFQEECSDMDPWSS